MRLQELWITDAIEIKTMLDDLPIYSSICTYCKHWIPDGKRHCTAFPAPHSIPEEIWVGDNNHRDRYPGDRGVKFEVEPSIVATASL